MPSHAACRLYPGFGDSAGAAVTLDQSRKFSLIMEGYVKLLA